MTDGNASPVALVDAAVAPPPPAAAEARPEPLLPLPFPLERRDGASPTVCVVVPVFNEAPVLERTYTELTRALDALALSWTVLFVNDGSRDDTVAVLESLFRRDERVGYLVLSRNFGHQAALTAGLDYADADVVVSMDGDLQHPPALLATLLAAWREGYDVVHTRKLATVGLSRSRGAATELAYRLVSRVSQVRIIAQASDYRLLDRAVLEAVRSLRESSRLYRGLTSWVGFRQCVIPYVAARRAAGRSQYGLKQLFGLFTRSLLDFSTVPLHAGLALGGVAVMASALYLLFTLGWLVVSDRTPPGWAAGLPVTLLINSVTLAAVGLVGAYVARIYHEVRGRPTYVLSRVRRRS